jgi:hypothetical protein
MARRGAGGRGERIVSKQEERAAEVAFFDDPYMPLSTGRSVRRCYELLFGGIATGKGSGE